jgi:hypothetical protein
MQCNRRARPGKSAECLNHPWKRGTFPSAWVTYDPCHETQFDNFKGVITALAVVFIRIGSSAPEGFVPGSESTHRVAYDPSFG